MSKPDEVRDLEALAEEAKAGRRKITPQLVPIRIVENVQLLSVNSQQIRRYLQGLDTRAGQFFTVEWFLVDCDGSTALYEGRCPYEFCEGKGTLMASTHIGKSGKAEMPFTDPGALCCDVCDSEIERRYNEEAARLKTAKQRRECELTAEDAA